MTKEERIKAIGIHRGYFAAMYGTEEATDKESFFDEAYESEENSRQFTPFEFLAKDINSSDNPEELWAIYDAGVDKGVELAWYDTNPHESFREWRKSNADKGY